MKTPTPSKKTLGTMDEIGGIELLQEDEAYGEWGGDVDLIRVYLYEGSLYADYHRYVGRSGALPPPDEMNRKWYEYKILQIKMDSIELNEMEKQLVELSIANLVKNKLRNNRIPVIGIYNSVISEDSSLVIMDYNSFEWRTFGELKASLKDKTRWT